MAHSAAGPTIPGAPGTDSQKLSQACPVLQFCRLCRGSEAASQRPDEGGCPTITALGFWDTFFTPKGTLGPAANTPHPFLPSVPGATHICRGRWAAAGWSPLAHMPAPGLTTAPQGWGRPKQPTRHSRGDKR